MRKTLDGLITTFPGIKVFKNEMQLIDEMANSKPDVILINVDLQPNDGIVVLQELNSRLITDRPYLIMYSDKQDDFLQELAYNSGADAFINFHDKVASFKPFLKNLLKRRSNRLKEIPANALFIDPERYLVFRNGLSIQLPRKEFQLLELLYSNAGKYFSKSEIADLLWKDLSIANKRIIDVHIYNIRQHFGKDLIHSQKGKGYSLLPSKLAS